MFAFASTAARSTISFRALSAMAEWHIRRDDARLARSVTPADLNGRNSEGRTLLDIYRLKNDRRAVEVIQALIDQARRHGHSIAIH